MSRSPSHAVVALPLLLASLIPAATGSAASLKGKVKKGVYQSPAMNFTIPVPSGLGMRVNDGFSRGGPEAGDIGGVSFHDDFGNLQMIAYMSLPAPPQFPDSAAELRGIEGFVREVAMPTWFLPASPNAEILRLAPASFQGKHAVLALVSLPGASPAMNMATGKRLDSVRGLVAFFHGRWAYLLGTETKSVFSALADSSHAAPADSAWTGFAGKLQTMFGTITFTQ